MSKCIKTDIAVIDPVDSYLYLIAELKFTPIYWSYLPLYRARKKLSKEALDELKKGLKRSINYLQKIRRKEPTQQYMEKTYFGPIDKHGRTKVEKLIGILNDFERKKGEIVPVYLCVIDEIYPNVEEILQKAIKKYNPPSQFKILAIHFMIYEDLEKTLEILKTV